MPEHQLRRVLDELYSSSTDDRIGWRARLGRQEPKASILELFLAGDTQGNAPRSKWAAVNAIVEYGDPLRPIRHDTERFARAIDASSAKTLGLELIVAA